MRKLYFLVVAASSALFILAPAAAQEIRILNTKATTLGTIDSPPGYQTVMLIAEVPPNTCGGRLTHPGIETSYILEGDFTLKTDGQPDKLLKAGDPFQVARSVVHEGCTNGGAKVLIVYVIEKGKPLASPAP
jgi:quercetin dioxygenase-like cupin family protein